MKHQFPATLGLAAALVTISLLTVSGWVLLAGSPLLLYLVASQLFQPAAPELQITRMLSSTRVSPGDSITVTIRCVNHGEWVEGLKLTDALPRGVELVSGTTEADITLPEGEEFKLVYQVRARRGSYPFTHVMAFVAGPFPLRSYEYRYDCPVELITLPDHRALSRIPIAPRRTLVYSGTNPARTGGEGTEFFDVRESSGSERLRHVNWRLTARKPDKLFVNEFQQERVADVAIMLDCRQAAYENDQDGRIFEAAANAAASLADSMLDAGNRVGYLGYGLMIDWITPGFGRAQKQRILVRIARSTVGESHVFRELNNVPPKLFPQGSQVVLVTPLLPEDVTGISRILAYGHSVLVVSPDTTPLQLSSRTTPAERASDLLARLGRSARLQQLIRAGAAVIDWDTTLALEEAVSRSLGRIQATWRRRRR